MTDAQAPAPTGNPEALTFTYTNWRGEAAERRVKPESIRVGWGSTEWHPDPQWLVSAFDLDKGQFRDFAWKDIALAPPAPTGDMVDISAFAYVAIGFLLDRLNEFEREIDDDQIGREYAGHVAPAVARLRQALTAAPSPSASTMGVKELVWEPITSAPKDGTTLLLFADAWSYTHGSVQTGYFDAGQWYVGDMVLDENDNDFDPLAEGDDEDDEDALLADSEENVGPTHWMHLPDDPGAPRRVQSCLPSAGGDPEWGQQEAYRKGFEAGGSVERERADWLEGERDRLQALVSYAGGEGTVEALREVRALLAVEYHEDGRVAAVGHDSAALRKMVAILDAALSLTPSKAETETAVPEPVLKAVERILDDHSAWVARPNDEVTHKIALSATIAAHHIIEQCAAYDAAETASERERLVEARIDTLEAALKPFADFIDPMKSALPDDMPMTKGSSLAARQVTAGDFRRARAALAQEPAR